MQPSHSLGKFVRAGVILTLLGLAKFSFGQVIVYGVQTAGTPNAPGSLYTVNTTTGAATLIGALGYNGVSAMDFRPTNGLLYGIGARTGDAATTLFTINTGTGATSEIGSLGIASDNITDMTFRSDGILFGVSRVASVLKLYTINTVSGAATLVSSFTALAGGNALSFDYYDNLYLVSVSGGTGTMFRLEYDLGTSSVIPHTQAALSPATFTGAMDMNPVTQEFWGFTTSTGTKMLFNLDISTSAVTTIVTTTSFYDAIAIAAIPEPSTYVMIFGVMAFGVTVWRRRVGVSIS